MALQRNGNGNRKTKPMNLKRSKPSDTTNGEDQGLMYKGQLRNITKQQLNSLIREDRRVVKWMKDLAEIPSFSREFILTCLQEIGLQCMGKIPRALFDSHVIDYKPKTAINAFKTMAEMQGYNVFKVDARLGILTTYNGPGNNPVEQLPEDTGPKMIELQDHDDIAAEVAGILSEAGALKSKAEDITYT